MAALDAAIIDMSAGQQPVITLDLAGYVSGWNRGAEALFGYAETEALGRHALFLDAEDADAAGMAEADNMAEADKRGVTPANGWCLPGNYPGLRTLEPRKGSSRPRRAL